MKQEKESENHTVEHALSAAVSHAKRYTHALAVLVIVCSSDEEHPQALIEKTLRSCIRREDLLSPIAKQAFAIALTEIHHNYDAGRVARKIMGMLPGVVRIGISVYPQTATTALPLLHCANMAAMRLPPEKSGYQYFSAQQNQQHVTRMSLEEELRLAIEKQQFHLEYQPQYDLASHRLMGMEALLRWQHPTLGNVPPEKIIALAEETGLIFALGRWVIESACRQCQQWSTPEHPHYRMGINISMKQLMDDQLVSVLANIIEQTKISPAQIEIELSETTVLDNVMRSAAVLNALQEIGVRVSIDDFGTSASLFSQLKDSLAVESVKIDKSFIRDLPRDQHQAFMTKSIIQMAKHMALNIVAEGVETESQANFLVENGCHLAQGFYLGRPLPAERIDQLLH